MGKRCSWEHHSISGILLLEQWLRARMLISQSGMHGVILGWFCSYFVIIWLSLCNHLAIVLMSFWFTLLLELFSGHSAIVLELFCSHSAVVLKSFCSHSEGLSSFLEYISKLAGFGPKTSNYNKFERGNLASESTIQILEFCCLSSGWGWGC